MYYLDKMYVDQIKEGDDYDVMEKCIHIGILNFIMFPEDKEYYSRFHLWEDTRKMMYSDKLEIHILELPKIFKNDYADNELLNWAKFFSIENRKELDEMLEKNEYIDKACEKVIQISADEMKQLEYEERVKALRDHRTQMNYNMKIGIEKGEERLSRLLECLNNDNKSEDMLRVLKDKEYRYQLYKEYNILDN